MLQGRGETLIEGIGASVGLQQDTGGDERAISGGIGWNVCDKVRLGGN